MRKRHRDKLNFAVLLSGKLQASNGPDSGLWRGFHHAVKMPAPGYDPIRPASSADRYLRLQSDPVNREPVLPSSWPQAITQANYEGVAETATALVYILEMVSPTGFEPVTH